MIGTPGIGELVVVFLIALLLFGAKRLPEIGSSLGKGIREFKGSVREVQRELTIPKERKSIHRTASDPAQLASGAGEDGSDSGTRSLTTSDGK
ncbi:MAG: twin-arginine translocase TatA/TatE family subunit [Gemmatimonadetes bacterium]|nr:twin-arginine translocase TatA/TatE family subunit [Gemmatimonadota bacterium]